MNVLSTLFLRHVRAGLLAASVASIVVVFVSLPLHSPDDALLNSLTVAIAVLAAGLAAGVSWNLFSNWERGRLLYAASLIGAFLAVTLVAVVAENQILERSFSFSVPLAAIALGIIGSLTPVLDRTQVPGLWWSTPVAIMIALGLGFALSGQGDGESGELLLPPRPAVTPSPVEAATTQPTQATVAVPTQPPPSATLTPAPTAESGDAAPPTVTPPASTPSPTPTPEPEPPGACPYTDGRCWVIGEGSEATFTVRERLVRLSLPNEAVVRTNRLSGELNLERPSVINIDLHSLSSDQIFRDRYIRNTMFPNSPVATFTVDGLGEIPEGFSAGDEVTGQVAGTLSIRGVEVTLIFDLEVRDDGDVLNIRGRTTFTWEQLQIPVPTARPVLWVEDEVKVEVLILARPKIGSAG